MTYTHLTQEQRYQIYILHKAGHPQRTIASMIGVHKSTLSRELCRNRGQRGYRAQQAQQRATERRHLASGRAHIMPDTWTLIEAQLRLDWSPQQVSDWLDETHAPAVSHERIYQHILADKQHGGDLYRHLRCQKQRRKRYGTYGRRSLIPNRIGIEQRPSIVDTRRRVGDWEVDTIIGKNHQQALVSLTERKSRLALIHKVERKTAHAVSQAIIYLLTPYRTRVHTLTSDNGTEFAYHEHVSATLDADFFFARPYASWQRGTNENTNGLIRQYFPKHRDFTTINHEEINHAMHRLNNRPRKILGFKTPNQVFFKSLGVALQT